MRFSTPIAVLAALMLDLATEANANGGGACNSGIYALLAPLSAYPAAQSYCTANYPPGTVTVTVTNYKRAAATTTTTTKTSSPTTTLKTSTTTKATTSSATTTAKTTTTTASADKYASLMSSLKSAEASIARVFCSCIESSPTVSYKLPKSTTTTTTTSTKPTSTTTSTPTTSSIPTTTSTPTTTSPTTTSSTLTTTSSITTTSSTTTASTTTSSTTTASTTTSSTTTASTTTSSTTTASTTTITTTSTTSTTSAGPPPVATFVCPDGSPPTSFYYASNGDVYGRCPDTDDYQNLDGGVDGLGNYPQPAGTDFYTACPELCSQTAGCVGAVFPNADGSAVSCFLKSSFQTSDLVENPYTDAVGLISQAGQT